ncbi:dynein axonemal assembly factor 6 [Rhinophrynus dorsalis]
MELTVGEFSSARSLEALCALLNAPTEEEDNHRDSCATSVGPGDIGPAMRLEPAVGLATPEKERDSKDIWDKMEVTEGSEFDDTLDIRRQPEFEILFKQRVGTEDIFLGMTRKDVSTACCEEILVRIQLPGTKVSDVSLHVRSKFLDLRTPKYKLGLHLPHPVDAVNGKARFVSDAETLEVTLSMPRDFDVINFL